MQTDGDPIDQVDTFQPRYRSFVARPPEFPETEITSGNQAQPSADVDLPVLTDIIDARSIHHHNFAAILETLQSELESEIFAWLVSELPASVANASQQILDELDSKARNTLMPRLNTLLEAHRAHETNTSKSTSSQ